METLGEIKRMLNWKKMDIESRFGFKGGKHLGVNMFFTFALGGLLSLAFYALVYALLNYGGWAEGAMFFHGGVMGRCTIPYYTVFLSGWCFAILFVKGRKLKLQRMALELAIIPSDPGYRLGSNESVRQVLSAIAEQAYDAENFILLDRINRTLSSLNNTGKISDVAEALKAQGEIDEGCMESTYTMLKGFIWAIPTLGFIGTVLGLSQAIGGFGAVVTQGGGSAALSQSLTKVTGGLATAFETTLIALVAALIIQLVMSMGRKREEDFLDECSSYCHRNIISRLRLRDPWEIEAKEGQAA